MPGRYLPLERGGRRRLRLRWTFGFGEVVAELDGREVARLEDREALRAGRRFALGDGTDLTLRLDRVLYPALAVERDGAPVPGSDTDPVHVARTGSWVLLFVAALAFVLGGAAFLSELEGSDATAAIGAVIALVFGGLGVALRRGHAWAALAGAVLEGLDAVNAVAGTLRGDATWIGVFARVAFAVILLRAWLVMRGAAEAAVVRES